MTDFKQPQPDNKAESLNTQRAGANLAAFLRSTPGRLAIISLAVVGISLAVEHQAHLIDVLPWLLILACPLMHVFMHKGHGGHAGHGHDNAHQAGPARVPVTSRREPRE